MLYGYRAGESELGSKIAKRKRYSRNTRHYSTLVNDDKQILIVEYPWSLDGNTYYDTRKRNSFISRLNVYSGIKRKVETLPFPGRKTICQ